MGLRPRRGLVKDPAHMKLVLEGGGARAAYSAGVVSALAHGGAKIHAVVGSSSGSVNAAFLASGNPEMSAKLWMEVVPGDHFISWRRQFTPWGPPGLAVDEMLDDIIRARGLLDEERATRGDLHLYVTATDVRARESIVARPTRDNLYEWLRASLALPVGYNRVVEVDGFRCVDGGVTSPVCFDLPLDEDYPGPIVVVLTRPMETKKPPPALWERWAVRTIVPAEIRDVVLRQHELHNAVMERLRVAVAREEVILVDPPRGMPLSRLTRDATKLKEGVAMGERVGAELARRLR